MTSSILQELRTRNVIRAYGGVVTDFSSEAELAFQHGERVRPQR